MRRGRAIAPMKNKQLILALAGYIFLMGLVGYFRSGSLAPIFISGSMALITAAFGHYLSPLRPKLRRWLVAWVVTCIVLFALSALELVGAHQNPSPGHELIFASLGLFSGYALYRLLKTR